MLVDTSTFFGMFFSEGDLPMKEEMKVKLRVTCIIYGKVSAGSVEMTERREDLIGEAHVPALPRVGDEIYLWDLSALFPYDLKVHFVSWEPGQKPGVLVPTLHLEDTECNDKTSARNPIELELQEFLGEISKATNGSFRFQIDTEV